jgi:FtsZ-binding cell division protein ZapB
MKQLFIILISLSSMIAYGQIDSVPLSLTKKYFNGEIRNYKSVLIGEAKDQKFNPKKISKDAVMEFETLMLKDNKAAIAVSLAEGEQHTDIYTFWTKDKDWKIKAFKALWLPGVFYMYYDRFKDLDSAGINLEYKKMIDEIKQRNDTLSDEQIVEQIGTLEDLQENVQNMRLTVNSDEKLKEHFYSNQEKFQALLVKIQNDSISQEKMWRIRKQPDYKDDLRELLLSGISSYNGQSLIDFNIGGMIDNSVGYLYCKNPDDIPDITVNRYIMIRKLDNGWYLYKTT